MSEDSVENSSKPIRSARILVAPLDWGLGHATRCIPVIRELIRQRAEVFIACEGRTKILLKAEFPELPFLSLPGYNIQYSRSAVFFPFRMAAQIPKILTSVKAEHTWLAGMQKKHHFTGIVSDNRYGLYHSDIPSALITHQLNIQAPSILQPILRKINYHFINRFSECWIPDAHGNKNLSGALSHGIKLPQVPVKYLGPLSRFSRTAPGSERHLLVLLSGPEPQRTLFEQMITRQLEKYTGPVVLVRGVPGDGSPEMQKNNITIYNHLPANALQDQMIHAEFVISRSGYSTVMDIAALQKRAILIPTPGQTEQQYLGAYLMKKKMALCIPQHKFRLHHALELARSFDYRCVDTGSQQLTTAIASFIH